MRIWIINHYALPPSCPGGTRHYTLAHELIKRGHTVALIAANFNHLTRQEIPIGTKANSAYQILSGVPFLWLRTPEYSGNNLGRLWNILVFTGRVLSKVKPHALGKLVAPDVIVGSSQHLFAAWAAERLARRYKVPFVFEVRDLMPQTLIDISHVSPKHPMVWVMTKIERYLYERATSIISLLPNAVEHIVEKGGRREKVVWIPNGVDFDVVPPIHPKANSHEKQEFTLIYAGSIGVPHGLDSVLDACKILRDKEEGTNNRFHFRFVGDGPAKIRLMQRVKDEGIDNVRFEQPVPRVEVFALLQQADAILVTIKESPLYKWGMSLNKLFDGLASARPIIFSAKVPLDPVAEAQAGLTVPPEDPEAMANAILQLAALSPSERWEMGLRGRQYVEENHDFVKLAERLEQILLQVTESKPVGKEKG